MRNPKQEPCSIDGCMRPWKTLGLCGTHYERLRIHGSTDLPTSPTAGERLGARLVAGSNGCLEWSGKRDRGGYGVISVSGRRVGAHRVAWQEANGADIPDGLVICHRCDNPPCCNPEHLFLGTVADNNADRDAKGRRGDPHAGKTHCPQGHAYDVANTYRDSRGWRKCRTCRRERMALKRWSPDQLPTPATESEVA